MSIRSQDVRGAARWVHHLKPLILALIRRANARDRQGRLGGARLAGRRTKERQVFVVEAKPKPLLAGQFSVTTVTIQPTPKRSVTIPKQGDQNVLESGRAISPPSERAAKA